jgi:hypothetical protein
MLMNNMNQLQDGSYAGYFVGTVVFNEDPLKKQRVKLTIPNLLEGPPKDLPWFSPFLASGFGNNQNSNNMQVPVLGSKVVVEFQNEDIHYGVYIGYVDSGEIVDDPELLINYPKRRGWRDPAGNKLILDYTSGQETVEFRHKSGANVFFDPEGNITVYTPTTLTAHSVGEMTLKSDTHIQLIAPRIDWN